MDRTDLASDQARPIVDRLNALIRDLYGRGVYMTSWYGCFPAPSPSLVARLKSAAKGVLGLERTAIGAENRGADYRPLAGAADDDRLPWYLYWEIVWVLTRGPSLQGRMRLLDAGGTASLFTCYLASLGHEVHSVDLNDDLVAVGNRISDAMGWDMKSYAMNMARLDFPDDHFDHAFSICVFEHLTLDIKQAALAEIARVLKPGGVLSITFDWRNPAPAMAGTGPDESAENALKTMDDIRRCFLSCDRLRLMGNEEFHDNGQSYLVHPDYDDAPYSFGAIFLQKVA